MSTTTIFNMVRDVGGYNGFGVLPSNQTYGTALQQNTVATVTAPTDSGNYLAVFSYTPGVDVFVNCNGTASAYTSTPTNVNSELLPSARRVLPGQQISLFTAQSGGANVQVSFYVIY